MELENSDRLKDLYLDLLKQSLTGSIYDESAWSLIETPTKLGLSLKSLRSSRALRALFQRWYLRRLGRQSMAVVIKRPFDAALAEEGKVWPLIGYSMVGHRRLDNVRVCVEDVIAKGVPGDLIETGAWRGGCTIFMRALLSVYKVHDRKVWVADSFEGLPAAQCTDDQKGTEQMGYLKVSLESVKQNFARFGLLDEQVKFLKGWFSDTLPQAPISKLALFRLDGDQYSSTMDALNALYSKVSPGGYVIVDDYFSWEPCHRAVTDFRTRHAIVARIHQIDSESVYWQVPGA